MFSQTDFCNYALQTLKSDQTLEQQIQILINKLEQQKPKINEKELSTILKQLQNQYNSKVKLINEVRSQLQEYKDSIEVQQSPEMTRLLQIKQRYENMKQLLIKKNEIYHNYDSIKIQNISTLQQVQDNLQLQITEDFQYIRQNNLFTLQNTKLNEIHNYYLQLCLRSLNKQVLSQQLLNILTQIPNILTIYIQANQNVSFDQLGMIIQNSFLLCKQQTEIIAVLKDFVLSKVNTIQISYNQLIQLTNILDKHIKSSISVQNTNEYREFYVQTLLQTKYSQNNLSTIEDLITNAPNCQYYIEIETFVHLFIAVIEQSKDVYEQMNATQLTGLLNKIKHVFSEIYQVYKGTINISANLVIKNDTTHIKALMTLQRLIVLDNHQKMESLLQLFDVIILSLLLSDFRMIIQSMNGALPDKFIQTRQLPQGLQTAEDLKTSYKHEKRVDGKYWINIVAQKALQLWERAVGLGHCDLIVLKAAFEDNDQQNYKQQDQVSDV